MASVTEALDVIYCEVCLYFGVDIKDKTQKHRIPEKRYYFIWLSDYFINTSDLRSEYSKKLYASTGIKRKYRTVIANYFDYKHTYVCSRLKTAQGYIDTDKSFARRMNILKNQE